MASIEVRTGPRGRRWTVRYRDPDGRTRRQTFDTKADAERFLHEVSADISRGSWRDPQAGKAVIGDVFETWLEERRVDLAPTTWALYESVGTRFIGADELARRPIGLLTQRDVRTWIGRLVAEGVGQRSIEVARQVLGSVCARAVSDGLIVGNPVTGTRPPRDTTHREHRRLLPEEVEAIADNIEPRYRALVYVGAFCGLRLGEALGLRWRRVDLLQRRLEVAEQLVEHAGSLSLGRLKTAASKRVVAIPAFVADELAAHAAAFGPADPEMFVFTAPTGRPVRRSNFRKRVWDPTLVRTNIVPARFHDLRHFAAAVAVANGAHPKTLQSRLGHASITMTLDTYGYLFDGLDADLADRMDETHRGRAVTALRRPS
jgi:integrase